MRITASPSSRDKCSRSWDTCELQGFWHINNMVRARGGSKNGEEPESNRNLALELGTVLCERKIT